MPKRSLLYKNSVLNYNYAVYFYLDRRKIVAPLSLPHNYYSAYHRIVTIHISKNRNDQKKRNDRKTCDNF